MKDVTISPAQQGIALLAVGGIAAALAAAQAPEIRRYLKIRSM